MQGLSQEKGELGMVEWDGEWKGEAETGSHEQWKKESSGSEMM